MRRNTRVYVAAVAVAVVVLGTVAAVSAGVFEADEVAAPAAGSDSGSADAEAAAQFTDSVPVWAQGTVIHYGEREIDTGRPITAFVRTDAAFVLAGNDGVVYSNDGAKTVEIGRLAGDNYQHLEADDTGSLVAWVEPDGADRWDYVVHDTATGEQVARVRYDMELHPSVENEAHYPSSGLYAIDDGAAYWRTRDGAVSYDLTTGRSTVLTDVAQPILDVADGILVHPNASGSVTVVRPDGTARDLPGGSDLSPDGTLVRGRWEATDYIHRTDTGSMEPAPSSGEAWLSPYGWYPDGRLGAVDVNDGRIPPDLIACTVGAACEVVVADAADAVTPTGWM